MLRSVILKRLKPCAYKIILTTLKCATLKKAFFYAASKLFILISNKVYKRKMCEKIRIKSYKTLPIKIPKIEKTLENTGFSRVLLAETERFELSCP